MNGVRALTESTGVEVLLSCNGGINGLEVSLFCGASWMGQEILLPVVGKEEEHYRRQEKG